MLSSEFESCLNQAFHQAQGARHELLRADLRQHIAANALPLLTGGQRPVQPRLGWQRVLQRAVFHVKNQGANEVGVLNELSG